MTLDNKNTTSNKELSYWMGQVDSKLGHITEMLSSQQNYWAELRSWRDIVNDRLSRGAQHFETHDRRIGVLEDDLKKHLQNHQKEIEKGDSEDVDNGDKYLSWSWIRDKILVPVVVWGIILLLGYLITNAISLP